MEKAKARDRSSKIIFGDPTLCAQFLRDFTNIPLLRDVRPEDIENMTDRYVRMFTGERDSDIVNRVHLRDADGNDLPFYLVSLIEHKSSVDYNVIMQVLRYIVYIWEDYEKEQNRLKRKISSTRGFKYPPVLPIIYYEGTGQWTAATRLHDRVYLSDVLGEYIPDYHCLLVDLQRYTKEDLMDKNDELALVMLINQLSKASDFAGLSESIRKDFAKSVTEHSPEHLLEIISRVVEALLVRINVPQDEVDEFVDTVKERKMGYLFDHFEDYDVQAERKRARTEGLAEGRAEGRAVGIVEGRAAGKAEGIAEAVAADIRKLAHYNMSRNSALTEEQALAEATAILS